MNNKTPVSLRRLALAVSLAVVSQAAYSLGLGKLEVHSALDEPLDARVPFTSLTQAEQSKLSAKLASRQDFKAAGIDYPDFLSDLKFNVIQSGNGPELHITTHKVLREPVVHLLLQLDWPEGRLIREYTALLDPPLYGNASTIQPRAAVAGSSRMATRVAPSRPAMNALTKTDSMATSIDPGTRYGPVREGESLWAISEKTYGVSDAHLFQIMASILRKNPGAFVDGNMHGLMAGAMLDLPARDEYDTLPIRQSYDQFVTQTEGWKQILSRLEDQKPKLAGAEISGPTGAGEAAHVAAKAGDAKSSPDKLEILVADNKSASGDAAPTGSASGATETEKQLKNRVALLEESLSAKDSETRELSERVRLLEQQLEKARKLIELQNADLARIQKSLMTGKQPSLAAAPSVENDNSSTAADGPAAHMVGGGVREQLAAAADAAIPKVDVGNEPGTETPAGAEVASEEGDIAQPDASVQPDASSNADVQPQEDTRPAMMTQEDAAEAPMPSPEGIAGTEIKPAPTVAAATPAERPRPNIKMMDKPEDTGGGFLAFAKEAVESALGNGTNKFLLPIAGVLALGLGFFIVRRRRSIAEFEESILATSTFETQSDLNMSEISEAAPKAEETFLNEFGSGDQTQIEEVDPISEAEVYLAYGRDEQAEKVLADGVGKDPSRMELKLKLLEVYEHRGKVREFETLAEEIYASHGQDAGVWGQVMAMGRQVSPANPLFNEAVAKTSESPSPAPKPAEAVTKQPEISEEPEIIAGKAEAPQVAESRPVEPEPRPEPIADEVSVTPLDSNSPADALADMGKVAEDWGTAGLDFDDVPDKAEAASSKDETEYSLSASADEAHPPVLDFDVDSLDFDAPELPKEKLASVDEAVSVEDEIMPKASDHALKTGGRGAKASDVLDFGSDDIPVFSQGRPGDEDDEMEITSGKSSLSSDLDWDENTTKLDLAKAYIDMGDADGARSILGEVLKEGNSMQKQQAADLMTQAASA